MRQKALRTGRKHHNTLLGSETARKLDQAAASTSVTTQIRAHSSILTCVLWMITASFMRDVPNPIGPRKPAVPNASLEPNRVSSSADAPSAPDSTAATRALVASRVSSQGSHAANLLAVSKSESLDAEAEADAAMLV
jgi:hypothetical protein